jgi:hypothetical protein
MSGRQPNTSTASIDDLLGYDSETPTGSGGGGTGEVVRALVIVAVATAASVFVLRAFGVVVPVALVAFGIAAVVALRHVLRLVAVPSAAVPRGLADHGDAGDASYHWPSPDAMRRAVLRWEQRLTWQADSPGTFSGQLQQRLRELADERLRQAYGVTIASDPARARVVLGERTWTMLTGVAPRAPGRRELTLAVARLEELT